MTGYGKRASDAKINSEIQPAIVLVSIEVVCLRHQILAMVANRHVNFIFTTAITIQAHIITSKPSIN